MSDDSQVIRNQRFMSTFSEISAADAAAAVTHGQTVAFGGFTAAGSIKTIGTALADRAECEHRAGRPFQLRILSSASTDDTVDGALAAADAISYRLPYQSNALTREHINGGQIEYFDMHLSTTIDRLKMGIFGPIDWAFIEAADVDDGGRILLTSGVGAAPTLVRMAKRIILEINEFHAVGLTGLHDIYESPEPPNGREIPLYRPSDRIGSPFLEVDPSKIVAVVRTNLPDSASDLARPSEVTDRIGQNVVNFLLDEMAKGRIPSGFLPLQIGVGGVANALMRGLLDCPKIPVFQMYSEILQDMAILGIQEGRISFASGSGLGISPSLLREIYGRLDYFLPRLLLRPEEITNSPEIIRRLGLIGVNTALEVDLSGNVNSSHVLGTKIMNGIGGSGDFSRNCHISIFTTPSTAKNGAISSFVPCCSHIDHTEHDTQIIISEFGVADLRNRGPRQRAEAIIENCAHPKFRPVLREYLAIASKGHIPFDLQNAFAMHRRLMEAGTMEGTEFH